MVNSITPSTIKVGIKSSSNTASAYWSIFTNFRLYFYGSYTKDYITEIENIAEDSESASHTYFDLTGRAVKTPSHGIYIRDGKKILVK